ncbi:MAG: MCE family protein [Schwartzia sp.]|nr:MCE family protein [Schwartzia sp. (in: firmicutes)]
MSNEAKVGAFTFLGVALILGIIIGINDFHFFGADEYRLNISFTEATGLNPGAKLKFAGVDAGTVETVENDGMAALVRVKVRGDVSIPRGSRIKISQDGLLTEKFIGIMPIADNGDYYADGDYIRGVDEKSMDSIMAQVDRTIGEVHELLISMNDVLGNRDMQKAVIQSSLNIEKLTRTMANLAQSNQDEITQMVHHMNMMSRNLMNTTAGVNALVQGFTGDGAVAADLKATIANINAASKRIDHMASSLEAVVTDPQTAEDLRETLHNVREVSAKANDMLGGLSGAHLSGGIDTMYSGMDSHWAVNADLRFYPSADKFLLVGVNDIGEENDFNFQLGKKAGALTARAGVVDSEVGLGVDADAGNFRFTVEAYDINDVALKGRVRYRLKGDTYLFGQVNDMTNRHHRSTYFGLRQEF